ncbi:MAG: SRPBCC family protein [Candidatus Obscuribacterales bacterium]|nr:SRPBCC family protein [Candidatus Obscuribacterales bacterium]
MTQKKQADMCKNPRATFNRLAVAVLIAANTISASSTAAYASEKSTQPSHASAQAHHPAVTEEKIGNRTYQVTRINVHAHPDHVWHVLSDYENAHAIFPCLKKCKVLHDRGNIKEVEQQIKPSGVPSTFTYVLEITETPGKLQQWRRLRGDFTEVEGFWKLEPAEDGTTLVTYASYVNGGFFMPQALIKRQTRADFPGVIAALKHQSESTRHIASHAQNLKTSN